MVPRRSIFRQAAAEQHGVSEQFDQLLPLPTIRDFLSLAPEASDHSHRLRTPILLQMDVAECGAVCLAIVLEYFGRHVPLESLRVACGVSRDGIKASNLLRAGRSYGLIVRAFTREPKTLRDLPLPQIVFWEFNHFLVVEGFDEHKVYLNDPASGPRYVSREDFDGSFTGIVLTCEPGPTFQRGGQRPAPWRSLLGRLRGARPELGFLLLLTLALLLPGLAIPVLAQRLLDQMLPGATAMEVMPLLASMALLGAALCGMTWLQQHVLLRLEQRIADQTGRAFFWHLLRLPITFFTQRHAGELGSRIALNEFVVMLLAERLATTIFSAGLIVVSLLWMARYDPLLSVVTLGIVLIQGATLYKMFERRRLASQYVQREASRLTTALIHGLQAIETVKANGAEEDLFVRWSGHQAVVEQARTELGLAAQALLALTPLATTVGSGLLLVIGALRVLNGELTIGALVAVYLLASSVMLPVGQLITLGGMLHELIGALHRLDDVLHFPVDGFLEEDRRTIDRPSPTRGTLKLESITFGYSPLAPPLLDKVDISLAPGQRVALVGPSGSGKSTLARLAAGLLAPWSGQVLSEGEVSFVDQEIVLFAGTIRENLTLWDSTIRDEVLMDAMRLACIADALKTRGGLEAPVAENGLNFSGGQRQRLEIARALARNPRILIFDEATNALDGCVEEEILGQLRQAGFTCLMVAHRLSTIRDCDEIVVLDQGSVVERGTHEALLARRGLYSRLIAEL
ncbi:MAG: ATP-binding cassette domain-containing protein [Ardenticatenales bacterium]|nr:ATP-binding cassette domain-containing protein [Ardenticatenales bacterium]